MRHARNTNELFEVPRHELRTVVGNDARLRFRIFLLGSLQNDLNLCLCHGLAQIPMHDPVALHERRKVRGRRVARELEVRSGLLRLYGARVEVTESLGGMSEAVAAAQTLASDGDAFLPDQFTNPANPEAHRKHTGPEIERALDRVSKAADGYPPYNIERIARENGAPERLRITLAVAGFTRDQLDVTVEENQLVIRGRQQDEKQRQYLHRGIAARQFQRCFVLADGMQVLSADLKNGLLSIDLVRPQPERTVKTINISDSE